VYAREADTMSMKATKPAAKKPAFKKGGRATKQQRCENVSQYDVEILCILPVAQLGRHDAFLQLLLTAVAAATALIAALFHIAT
jgi:hypothetical protein